jgi:hypothetical protein
VICIDYNCRYKSNYYEAPVVMGWGNEIETLKGSTTLYGRMYNSAIEYENPKTSENRKFILYSKNDKSDLI